MMILSATFVCVLADDYNYVKIFLLYGAFFATI